MAPVIEEASGATGSSVFVPSPFGQLLRRNVRPANPNTARQQLVRAGLSQFSAQWKTISRAFQNGWRSLATTYMQSGKYGASYASSAQRLFVNLNQNLRDIGAAQITAPPSAVNIPPALVITAGAVVHDQSTPETSTVALTVSGLNGNGFKLFATPPLSLGRFSFGNATYRMILADDDDGSLNTAQISAAYKAKFGTIPTGGRVAFKLIGVEANEGWASQPTYLDVDITTQA